MKRQYMVKTNGLVGNTTIWAKDPDDAAGLIERQENFLQLIQEEPGTAPEQAMTKVMNKQAPAAFRISLIKEKQ